jgi:predicted PurR-regulated permease PerM
MTETDEQKELIKTEPEISESEATENNAKAKLWIILGAIILIAIITGIVSLAFAQGDTVGKIRDIFIILMALIMFIIGVALVVLIIQLADLTNLLKNEVRPIIRSTNDTVNTLKGTVRFMSDNLAEPVIKMNENLAGIKKIASFLGFKK